MEAELTQALLEMSMEQGFTSRDTMFDRAKGRAFAHIRPDGTLPPILSTLRQIPKKEVERDIAPAVTFLDKKEPPMRDAMERMTRQVLDKPSGNWAKIDDQAYHIQTDRVNPQQAYLDARNLPVNGYRPEYSRAIEFGRTPNPTEAPLVPFSENRLEREVTREPRRGHVEKSVVGNAINPYGPDEGYRFRENLLDVPNRSHYLEGQMSHQFKRDGIWKPEDAQPTVNGMRLRGEDYTGLLEARWHAGGRGDLGDSLVPNMLQKDKQNVVIEPRIPGATKLGEFSQDARTTSFNLEAAGRRVVDRSQSIREPVIFLEKRVQHENRLQEHLVAEYVEMLVKHDEPRLGREIERPEVLDDIQTILLRTNPYHVPYLS